MTNDTRNGERARQQQRELTIQRRALNLLRGLTTERGSLEKGLRSVKNASKFALRRPVVRRDLYVANGSGERFGVFAMGGCDVRTVVGAGPMIARRQDRPLCVGSFAFAPESRSDLICQTLDPPPDDVTAEVIERLELSERYFAPDLFEPEFGVPDQFGLGSWPKDVVVLSISSDVGRTVYEHRQHGFLVDPGGWWLAADMGDVLGDLSAVKWFASQFRKLPRISVEDSMANFESIITNLRERTGAFVVVMNVLTVDPGAANLEYKHANSPNRLRRREFREAIAHLGRHLEFPVLDVDSLAKQLGISGQADFVHYTKPQKRLISQEFTRLLADSGVIG